MITTEDIKKLRQEAHDTAVKFMADENNRKYMSSEKNNETESKLGTYIYIRAVVGDNGSRPLSPGTVCWLSPDVELFDSNGTRITTTDVSVNSRYTVQVTVRNDGDHDCNSCMVDLFLDDPSIGFNVASSELIGSQTVSVSGHSSQVVSFPFEATPLRAGHRCLFARAYSLMTNDYPADWINFNVMGDRHVGQQNLNIVQQGTAIGFRFGLGGRKGKGSVDITIRKNTRIVPAMNIPLLAKYFVVNKAVNTNTFSLSLLKTRPEILKKSPEVIKRGNTIAARIPQVAARIGVLENYTPILVNRPVKDRWTFASESGDEKFNLEIPHLGLNPNEAIPMDITVTDTQTGAVLGGITLLIVGR
jgi:hypothetical protein